MKTKIEVRIDTETPGAKIRYGIHEKSSNTADWSWTWNENDGGMTGFLNGKTGLAADPNGNYRGVVSQNVDADIADLTGLSLTGSHNSGVVFPVGDDIIMTARKDYVAAEASRSGFTEEDASGRGYEGVFKTAVFFRGRTNSALVAPTTGTGIPLIQGNSQATGVSVISGFPLKDNPIVNDRDEFQMFSKHMYRAGQSGGNPNYIYWAWISWEIITDWWEISCIDVTSGTKSFQNNGGVSQYNQGSYGNFIYRQNQR
jgi:hypothetical protein